jgi:adenylate kinase family enzyme
MARNKREPIALMWLNDVGAPMKLLVTGNSGSGKSTYAARLATVNGLVCLELDSIVWEPHQIAVPRPLERVRSDLSRFLAKHDRWVLEGCDGDLIAQALPSCSSLVFLNPDRTVCLENNRRRPWEPHKYDSVEDQERMLPHLLAWVESYYTRDDPRSYSFHRRLFDDYPGDKREIRDLAEA